MKEAMQEKTEPVPGVLHAVPTTPLPAEVRKVVDAFRGRWTFDTTVVFKGASQTQTLHDMIDFTEVASGYAVNGISKGSSPEMGLHEEAMLIFFDQEIRLVRFISVTSMGYMNDFKGSWTNDRTLVFMPLNVRRNGQLATVHMTIEWAGDKALNFRQVAVLEDGSTMSSAEGTGIRG